MLVLLVIGIASYEFSMPICSASEPTCRIPYNGESWGVLLDAVLAA